MQTTHEQIGRVIRVGRGWADVGVERRIVRHYNPDSLSSQASSLGLLATGSSLTETGQRGPARTAH